MVISSETKLRFVNEVYKRDKANGKLTHHQAILKVDKASNGVLVDIITESNVLMRYTWTLEYTSETNQVYLIAEKQDGLDVLRDLINSKIPYGGRLEFEDEFNLINNHSKTVGMHFDCSKVDLGSIVGKYKLTIDYRDIEAQVNMMNKTICALQGVTLSMMVD